MTTGGYSYAKTSTTTIMKSNILFKTVSNEYSFFYYYYIFNNVYYIFIIISQTKKYIKHILMLLMSYKW